MSRILENDEAFKTTMRNSACASDSYGFVSHLNHYIGLGLTAANQHRARIGFVERLGCVLDLTFEELACARVTDPRSTAEGRAKPVCLCKTENALL